MRRKSITRPRRQKTTDEAFWPKVEITPDCWLWTAGKSKGRYGLIRLGSPTRTQYAHRVSFALHFGGPPAGLHVLHTCDVPNCVRPDHLWLGTVADNMADRDRKGRAAHQREGFKMPKRGAQKITEEQAKEIKRRLATGSGNNAALARELGLPYAVVGNISRGTTWKDIP